MLKRETIQLPKSKKWLVDGFCRYTRKMVAKRFDSFGVQLGALANAQIEPASPIVVYANHAGWWDPIVAMLVRQAYFSDRKLFAPIDLEALKKYRVMASMGFYGVKLNTFEGVADFLLTTKAILETPNCSVWITPEGRFCDVRDHSQPFMPGMAHLATKLPHTIFIPMAIEYGYWDQPRPQIFVRFGDWVRGDDAQGKGQWNEALTKSLRKTQSELSAAVISRDASQFNYLIESRPNRLGWYDYGRSWVAWARGEPFDPRHITTE
jgi:1-acyl-sn-glycerol-3-phosphate acyltransferase